MPARGERADRVGHERGQVKGRGVGEGGWGGGTEHDAQDVTGRAEAGQDLVDHGGEHCRTRLGDRLRARQVECPVGTPADGDPVGGQDKHRPPRGVQSDAQPQGVNAHAGGAGYDQHRVGVRAPPGDDPCFQAGQRPQTGRRQRHLEQIGLRAGGNPVRGHLQGCRHGYHRVPVLARCGAGAEPQRRVAQRHRRLAVADGAAEQPGEVAEPGVVGGRDRDDRLEPLSERSRPALGQLGEREGRHLVTSQAEQARESGHRSACTGGLLGQDAEQEVADGVFELVEGGDVQDHVGGCGRSRQLQTDQGDADVGRRPVGGHGQPEPDAAQAELAGGRRIRVDGDLAGERDRPGGRSEGDRVRHRAVLAGAAEHGHVRGGMAVRPAGAQFRADADDDMVGPRVEDEEDGEVRCGYRHQRQPRQRTVGVLARAAEDVVDELHQRLALGVV